jgi:hypothetical protein
MFVGSPEKIYTFAAVACGACVAARTVTQRRCDRVREICARSEWRERRHARGGLVSRVGGWQGAGRLQDFELRKVHLLHFFANAFKSN